MWLRRGRGTRFPPRSRRAREKESRKAIDEANARWWCGRRVRLMHRRVCNHIRSLVVCLSPFLNHACVGAVYTALVSRRGAFRRVRRRVPRRPGSRPLCSVILLLFVVTMPVLSHCLAFCLSLTADSLYNVAYLRVHSFASSL